MSNSSSMIWIELNAKIEPFDDPRVRQAMNFAFPQEQILETVFQGLGSPLNGCMPSFYPGFTNKFWKYKYDLETAKALLKEASLPSNSGPASHITPATPFRNRPPSFIGPVSAK